MVLWHEFKHPLGSTKIATKAQLHQLKWKSEAAQRRKSKQELRNEMEALKKTTEWDSFAVLSALSFKEE